VNGARNNARQEQIDGQPWHRPAVAEAGEETNRLRDAAKILDGGDPDNPAYRELLIRWLQGGRFTLGSACLPGFHTHGEQPAVLLPVGRVVVLHGVVIVRQHDPLSEVRLPRSRERGAYVRDRIGMHAGVDGLV